MIISVLMNLVNLLLGLLLIHGANFLFWTIPGFGVTGAAMALLIARVFGLLVSGYVLLRKVKRIRLNRIKYFKPNFSMQKTILKVGMPTSFESGLFNAGALIIQMMVVSMSTAAIATHAIASNIMGFINVPGNALATGLMILVGQRIGRENIKDVIPTVKFTLVVGTIAFAAICLLAFFLRFPVFGLYSPSPETLEYLNWVFIIALIATPLFWSASFIAPAALRASGDVVYPMWVSIFSMLVLRVGLSYIFGVVLGMGILGIWMAACADWLLRGICFWVRLMRGKWKGKAIR